MKFESKTVTGLTMVQRSKRKKKVMGRKPQRQAKAGRSKVSFDRYGEKKLVYGFLYC